MNKLSYSIDIRIPLKSALAAGLCLGIPAGLVFWLNLIQDAYPALPLQQPVEIIRSNGYNNIIVLTLCSIGWSYFLSRISGYRPWWRIGLATAIGILAGWFSPLSNLDGWLVDDFPPHAMYTVTMGGIVFSVTLGVGLVYGLLLRSIKAALTLALATSLVSVLALLLTIVIFDRVGVRVGGTVPLAMSRVTTTGLLFSALSGGAILGTGFRWFVEKIEK